MGGEILGVLPLCYVIGMLLESFGFKCHDTESTLQSGGWADIQMTDLWVTPCGSCLEQFELRCGSNCTLDAITPESSQGHSFAGTPMPPQPSLIN